MNETWGKIMDEDNTLLYEGFTRNNKPYGTGVSYFSNGYKYQEGIFGIKGLLLGKEYYPNGQLRFEGIFKLNTSYGPNYLIEGQAFTSDGQLIYDGKLSYLTSGLGYPLKAIQCDIGQVIQKERPNVPCFMWRDADSE